MINQEVHINHFTEVYKTDAWGNGSGNGSRPENTNYYREYLSSFIKDNNIKTVFDYGCGDWQFSHLIDWSGVNYTGVDCVKSLIEGHNKTYASDTIKFDHIDSVDKFLTYKGDLLILKDVLQHWLNDEIIYFLDNVINNFDYILITNCYDQSHDWQEAVDRLRPLTSDLYPLKKYNIKKKATFTTASGVSKQISLITKNKQQ
jgi:SAM-dependent methyltransferase